MPSLKLVKKLRPAFPQKNVSAAAARHKYKNEPSNPPTIVTELRLLLTILTQCLGSFRDDFKKIDCKKPDSLTTDLIPSLVFKLEKIAQCAKSIQKIIQSAKKNNFQCLPCFTPSSVEEKPSK